MNDNQQHFDRQPCPGNRFDPDFDSFREWLDAAAPAEPQPPATAGTLKS